MSDTILKGPYEISVIVHVTDGDDANGAVTITATMGHLPTQEDIDDCLKKAENAVAEQGFRLMNKSEFFNQMMRERLGATEKFACPGGNEWDA
jgi:hypothetical protein